LKPLILVVEDNRDILFNLNLILESNNYEPITSRNGKEALEILKKFDKVPDIIISDIMMPEMDGYEFFKEVSNNSRWNRIPFLFLSARSTPQDIRFGKLLGVDDYITKPFKEKDLLAVLSGKIARLNRIKSINNQVNEIFSNVDTTPRTSHEELQDIMCMFLVIWDDKFGPKLEISYPAEKQFPISLDDIANQLFTVATSIYGHEKITKAEDVLLKIENLNNRGYLFFDSYPEKGDRYGEKQYMLAVIAPSITYFHSLKIREIFVEISVKIKNKEKWDVKQYWKRIYDIMTTDPLKINLG
jgi:CheY-like chemotaxis protein